MNVDERDDQPQGLQRLVRGVVRSNLFWLVTYLLCMAALVLVMQRARTWTLATQTTPQAQQDWEAWRTAARQQTGEEGPVKRRPPVSDEPPAVVLMRDQFLTCAISAAGFATAIFVVFVFMLRGVMA